MSSISLLALRAPVYACYPIGNGIVGIYETAGSITRSRERNPMPEQLQPEGSGHDSWANLGLWLLSAEFKLWLMTFGLLGAGIYCVAVEELSLLSWKETEGTVLESKSVWPETSRSSGIHLSVEIRYRYVVDGRVYESNRYTTGDRPHFINIQDAAALRKSYPPGKIVTVLYATYDPSQATLFAERGNSRWILFGFGVPCLLVVYFTRRRRLRDGEKPHPDVDIAPFIHL
jgi:hypothetical protein